MLQKFEGAGFAGPPFVQCHLTPSLICLSLLRSSTESYKLQEERNLNQQRIFKYLILLYTICIQFYSYIFILDMMFAVMGRRQTGHPANYSSGLPHLDRPGIKFSQKMPKDLTSSKQKPSWSFVCPAMAPHKRRLKDRERISWLALHSVSWCYVVFKFKLFIIVYSSSCPASFFLPWLIPVRIMRLWMTLVIFGIHWILCAPGWRKETEPGSSPKMGWNSSALQTSSDSSDWTWLNIPQCMHFKTFQCKIVQLCSTA